MNTQPLVIYHDHCTDGYGAAFAAWLGLDDADFLPMNHGQQRDPFFMESCIDREVYVLDFSFDIDTTKQLMEICKKFVWLDHHKTSFEMWCGSYTKGNHVLLTGDKFHIELDDTRSGAMLAWQYFHPTLPVPKGIRCIDDRDRWVFAIPDSKAFHAGMQAQQPWSFGKWYSLLIKQGSEAVLKTGRELLAEQGRVVAEQAKQAVPCELYADQQVFKGLVINTRSHVSEVGHALANMSGTFGLVWYVGADGVAKCSLRSNGDYDVSKIARLFGGGGHMNSAGFETTVATVMGWMK